MPEKILHTWKHSQAAEEQPAGLRPDLMGPVWQLSELLAERSLHSIIVSLIQDANLKLEWRDFIEHVLPAKSRLQRTILGAPKNWDSFYTQENEKVPPIPQMTLIFQHFFLCIDDEIFCAQLDVVFEYRFCLFRRQLII